jgi:hypothetical protein
MRFNKQLAKSVPQVTGAPAPTNETRRRGEFAEMPQSPCIVTSAFDVRAYDQDGLRDLYCSSPQPNLLSFVMIVVRDIKSKGPPPERLNMSVAADQFRNSYQLDFPKILAAWLIAPMLIVQWAGPGEAGTLQNYDSAQYRIAVTFSSGRFDHKIIPGQATVLGLCSFAGCQLAVVETGQVLRMGPEDSVIILNGRATIRRPPFPTRRNGKALLPHFVGRTAERPGTPLTGLFQRPGKSTPGTGSRPVDGTPFEGADAGVIRK